jgi:hypothetical protein
MAFELLDQRSGDADYPASILTTIQQLHGSQIGQKSRDEPHRPRECRAGAFLVPFQGCAGGVDGGPVGWVEAPGCVLDGSVG